MLKIRSDKGYVFEVEASKDRLLVNGREMPADIKMLGANTFHVKKGENLVVLEAMKMENIIKAPSDVRIGSIKVAAADKVEKNQVMITFA